MHKYLRPSNGKETKNTATTWACLWVFRNVRFNRLLQIGMEKLSQCILWTVNGEGKSTYNTNEGNRRRPSIYMASILLQ